MVCGEHFSLRVYAHESGSEQIQTIIDEGYCSLLTCQGHFN